MANRYWVGGDGNWDASDTTHWAASSGGAGGQSVPGAADIVYFDGSSGGGVVTPSYDMLVTTITMNAFTGTLDFSVNNNNPTMANFNCSGTGTRVLKMGSGTWTITGSGITLWNMTTTTNLTLDVGTSTVDLTYSGSVGTRTVNLASLSLNKIKVSAGTDIFTFGGAAPAVVDIDFTGFTGAWSSNNIIVSGNFTLGAGMTMTDGAGVTTLNATSGVKIITTNNVVSRGITMNGVGGSWQLADSLTMLATRTLTLTNGSFNANNQNINIGFFSSSNSNIRAITMGSGTWAISGVGIVWNLETVTNLTLLQGTSTIKITDATNTANTFKGGGKTYNNIWFSRGASTATNTITGANTFSNFKDDGSEAHTIVFPNVTTTVSSWTVSGTVGKLITLSRTGASGQFTLAAPTASPVSANYLSISNSVVSPLSGWFAGLNSVDGGGNTGWVFNPKEATKFFALI